jgi:(p)ppGpp synthase/HD superfamily hydrolase
MSQATLPLLFKATALAFEAHKEQFRKGTGIPYVNHLCEVTSRVAHYLSRLSDQEIADKLSVTRDEILAAAMLHDYMEDCGGKFSYVKEEFSENVAILVQECTREDDHETKLLKLAFLVSFKSKSSASILIKIADRYCNVQDYYRTEWKLKYASKYAVQAYTLYSEFLKRDLCLVSDLASEDIETLSNISNVEYRINIYDENQEDLVKSIVT